MSEYENVNGQPQNTQYQNMPYQNMPYQNMQNQNTQYQNMPYQNMQPQQNGNAAPVKAAGNPEVCEHVSKVMSSNMGFAAAIISACPLLFMILSMITGAEPGLIIVLMIPLIFAPIEAWVTFGTARWGKGKTMRGGIVLGKVISVMQIVLSGIMILLYLICAIIYAASASIIGNMFDGIIEGILSAADIETDVNFVNKITSFSTGIVFLLFILMIVPYILNIVMNILLNTFRNGIIDAMDGVLNKFQKTMALAVLIILVGLPLLIYAILLFVAMVSDGDASYIFMALGYIIAALMYFYSGAMVIVFGKGK